MRHGIIGLVSFAHLVMFSTATSAQEFPVLSQRIADCEDRWILHQSNKAQEQRLLGYVYVDPTAGVTIELHGEVELDANGALVRLANPLEGKARVIYRVESNNPATCLSDEQTAQLGLPREWEYRENYRDKRPAGEHYTAWASHFNQLGAFDRALEFVELAQAVKYASPKLELEHGFALNALEHYDDAIKALDPAFALYRDDVEITAELAYANLNLGHYPRAIELYRFALDSKHNTSTRRWEFAHNIANAYSKLGDIKNERKWRTKAEEWKGKK